MWVSSENPLFYFPQMSQRKIYPQITQISQIKIKDLLDLFSLSSPDNLRNLRIYILSIFIPLCETNGSCGFHIPSYSI
ncbi:MAG: hypothetical protein ABIF11_02090 [Nitrospirota bacterium]